MNEATKKTLSQLKELTDNEKHDARQKFARVKDAISRWIILTKHAGLGEIPNPFFMINTENVLK